jgi:GNAT superfamily N-acetyltransferase
MATKAEVVFEPLGPERDRSAFSCGEPVLDDYLRRRAAQDVRRKVARAFVAVDRATGGIAGYYTLSAASFSRQQLPEAVAKRLPHYPVPAAILGRLAVDRRYQGRGLGELMLADAIKRVLHASEVLAVHAIVVDAKNDRARHSTSAMVS